MTKSKYCALIALFAFASVLPVSAAQMRVQNAKAEEAGQSESSEATETTDDYIKNRLKEMKEMRADEKATAKEAVLKRIRERVGAMIQNAVRRYERVQAQARAAEGLTEAEKAALEAKVTAQIEAMTTLQAQLEGADTVAEMKQVMTQVKTRFKLSLGLMRQSVSGVFEDRLNTVMTKLTDVYTRLSEKVTALPDGEEKTELSALLAGAQTFLAEAKNNIEAGELVEAKENLIDAKENLVEVAGGLK